MSSTDYTDQSCSTGNKYWEVEVPDGGPYSYLRLGSWQDEANAAAASVNDLKDKAGAAGETPTEANINALATASGADAAELRQLLTARNQAHAARAAAFNAYDRLNPEYQRLATASQTAFAELSTAQAAYDQGQLDGVSSEQLATLRQAFETKRRAYETAETAHQAARQSYVAARTDLQEANDSYQAAKQALQEGVAGAFEAGRQTTIEAARLDPRKRLRGHDLAAQIVDFFDDERKRGPFTDLSVAERKAESRRLHTKGGWRDHSEGNRISTTRGDKVEVIQGNYRRLVMGRQYVADNGCLLDASGGLYRDGDFAPGSVVLVEHSTIWTGDTWLSVEETEHGNVVNKYHGNVQEVFYGEKVETITGSNGGSWGDGGQAFKPTVTDKSWIKSLTEECYVDEGITSTTEVTGTISDTTKASMIRESTTASHSLHSTTHVGAGMVDMTAVGAGIVEMTTVGASHIEMEAATTHIGLELSGLALDLFLGALKVDINVSKLVEVKVEDNEAILIKNSVSASQTTTAASTTTTAASTTTTAASSTTTAASSSTVAASQSTTAASSSTNAASVRLGSP